MITYLGFIPSQHLNTLIDDAIRVITTGEDTAYYPYRDAITHQVAAELIDNLMTELVAIIPNAERQRRLYKVVDVVKSSTDSLINHVLSKQDNDQVMDSFEFLQQHTLFTDSEGQRRVGFVLSQTDTAVITTGLAHPATSSGATHLAQTDPADTELTDTDDQDTDKLKDALDRIIAVNLQHYLLDFTQTLHLGLLKRGAIPIAHATIAKVIITAINHLLPQLPAAALQRIRNHYQPFVVARTTDE